MMLPDSLTNWLLQTDLDSPAYNLRTRRLQIIKIADSMVRISAFTENTRTVEVDRDVNGRHSTMKRREAHIDLLTSSLRPNPPDNLYLEVIRLHEFCKYVNRHLT